MAGLLAARILSAHFERVTLIERDKIEDRLPRASLSGADLSHAILRQARLERADLRRADLRDAELSGADLTGALGLTQFQLNAACGDESTRLAPYFTVPRCQ